jgi:glycosyltransferase involved in cell wall biosynthesis
VGKTRARILENIYSFRNLKAIDKIKSRFSSIEFRLILKRAAYYGYSVQHYQQAAKNENFLENVFGTSLSKTALLSYITIPFKARIQYDHSNHAECYTIAEVLRELGYNVDVIDWHNNSFIPQKKYSLVIDNHNNLCRLAIYFANACKIFHATNAHWLYQNNIEYERCLAFFKTTGAIVHPGRQRPPGDSAAFADRISMFGNGFTANTYGVFKEKILHVPMSVTVECENLYNKDFNLCKTKFLWLNSHGALLKGLDILIEVFKALPQLELCICHDAEKDKEFFKAIQSQLVSSPNIKMIGWVDVHSDQFNELVGECCWAISTSWSEGGGGSILNCMAKGLIPVITESCSISLPTNCGYYIDNNDLASVSQCLKKITKLNEDCLAEMSKVSVAFIRENHTLENFRNKYREFLIDTLTHHSI